MSNNKKETTAVVTDLAPCPGCKEKGRVKMIDPKEGLCFDCLRQDAIKQVRTLAGKPIVSF